ncbi:MAG: MFS transporter, partial [Gemmatimonadota bacterium]
IFPLFLQARFGIDESTIGYVFLYVGMVSVLVRGLTVGPLVRRLGEPFVSRLGAALLAVGMGLGALADSYLLLGLAFTFIAGGTGTLFPPLAALISRCTAPEMQGSTLGVNQFFGGVGRVFGPLWGAAVFDVYGSGAPFITAGVGVGLAFLLTLRLRRPEALVVVPARASRAEGGSKVTS